MVSFQQVARAPDQTVWKVQSMRGYMLKDVGAATDGSFSLVFKKANGSTTYTYAVSSAGAITAPSAPIQVDGEFLKLLMSQWDQVDKDAADAVLGGTGSW